MTDEVERCGSTFESVKGEYRCELQEGHTGRHQSNLLVRLDGKRPIRFVWGEDDD